MPREGLPQGPHPEAPSSHRLPDDEPATAASPGRPRIITLDVLRGFALLLNSAANRAPRPRLVLLRWLVALLAIGLVNMLLRPFWASEPALCSRHGGRTRYSRCRPP